MRRCYFDNALMAGADGYGEVSRWMLDGSPVDLSRGTVPALAIGASSDHICPPKAATALNALVGTDDTEVVEVPGGHVGAVVGSKGPKMLYPAVAEWLEKKGAMTWN